jgi:aromatic-L-amino-acid decarboxylase
MRVDLLQAAIAADRAAGLNAVHGVLHRRHHQHRRGGPARRGRRPRARAKASGITSTARTAPSSTWCRQLRPLLAAGFPRADSLTLDPHKGLFLPYGTGALLVRDGEALRALHASDRRLPARPSQDDVLRPGAVRARTLARLPRPPRLAHAQAASAPRSYRAALAEKRALAVWAAGQVAAIPGIVIDAAPQLSLFAFHMEGPGLETRAAQDAATKALMERVTQRGRIMMTGATAEGRFVGRICVLSFRTRRAEMELAVQQLREEAAAILAGARAAS